MELLFVTVIGAALALILRYLLPKRGSYGILLLPGVGAVVSAAVWVALVWAGWRFDGTWIWVASLVAAGAAALVLALVLPGRRDAADSRMLRSLSGGKA